MNYEQIQKLSRKLLQLEGLAKQQKKIIDDWNPSSSGLGNVKGRYEATLLDIKLAKQMIDKMQRGLL